MKNVLSLIAVIFRVITFFCFPHVVYFHPFEHNKAVWLGFELRPPVLIFSVVCG